MVDFAGIAGDQLKLLIERIERLEEDKRALGEDIKEVYAEAKGTGFEPKIMRQLIKIRKMGKGEHDEQESLLDLYKRAIGMLPEAGPSAQAAEQASSLELTSHSGVVAPQCPELVGHRAAGDSPDSPLEEHEFRTPGPVS